MTGVRAAALHFEAVKVALRQSKDGVMLTLSIHPNDMRGELWQHHIGSRYMVALVRLGDDEQPVLKADRVADATKASDREAAPKMTAGKLSQPWNTLKLKQRAGIMCNDTDFWAWAQSRTPGYAIAIDDEKHAADWLRWKTAVGSRKEYDTDAAAGRRYLEIENAYIANRMDKERFGDA